MILLKHKINYSLLYQKIKVHKNRYLATFGNADFQNSKNVFQRREFEPRTPDPDYIPPVPEHARVVVCGGGIMGSSVVYHLAKNGWGKDTVLIEQSKISDGNPWHESGLVGRFYPTITEIKLAQYSYDLIRDLTKNNHPTGWKEVGSLNVARTFDRMTWFRRMKSIGNAFGIQSEILSPKECKEKCPHIEFKDLEGGLWLPSDGVCNPHLLCQTFVKEAQRMGASIIENCALKRVKQTDGKVSGVETTSGNISCEFFVNCTGFWAHYIGRLSDPQVKIPLHPVQVHFLHTKPIPWLPADMPVIRDMDGKIYIRGNDGTILAGGFELEAKPAFEDGRVPTAQSDRELPPDWDHFYELLEEILKRMPCLEDVVIDRLTNGPEAFSPDCKWIVGESPEIKNYFISAGMKTIGVSGAGGIGRAIADIIVKGFSRIDVHLLDISRFLGLHNNRKFLKERCKEVPGLKYKIPYPFDEFKTGRNLRMSPIYPSLKEAGAVFGQTMGYERPNYYDPRDKLDELGLPRFRIAETNTFGKPPWFEFVSAEYNACRERVGLADYSSFTKYDISSKGREVVDFLQYLCSNDVDVQVGSIIHTGMQNNHGGYENDCSIVRLSENHYMLIAPTIQQKRSLAYIRRHISPGSGINITDITSMYTAICILGPYTRALLSELTDTDLSPSNFPFFTYKELDVGLANGVRALNITHTGELGYVLYIPNEFALHVYSRLWEAGQRYGIQHAGYYATRTLRIEKFFAFWGQDLDTFTTPLECGRTWRVKLNKDIDFIGREALLKQRAEGVKKMYVQLLLNDHDPEIDLWCWGGEPIYRNGKYSGMTTTTGYGFTLKKQVCLGFIKNYGEKGESLPVTNDFILSGHYEVEVAGLRFEAKVNLHSPNLPTKFPDREREAYKATRDKPVQGDILSYRT
ncbi:pyruvate dehydrogenase phosphatase regulatory subunit, mitochondrial [Condylostylus longicornis]|uniref:pyruvate dehydrogenase phosphatase regulatory subunit, mitochondrial n=1 Tax=Condylostylus longicornis TaxID=2530218 RepID=UPI00244E1E68|nr:pyruvate dehydrogenase phosphatase regulatory subunit, mitochondrial [Condylostylus longicornis]